VATSDINNELANKKQMTI